jgi:hypothetical protein
MALKHNFARVKVGENFERGLKLFVCPLHCWSESNEVQLQKS